MPETQKGSIVTFDWAIEGCPDPTPQVNRSSKTAIIQNLGDCDGRARIAPVYGSISHLTESVGDASFWTEAIRKNFILFTSNFRIREGLVLITHAGCRGAAPYLEQRRLIRPSLTDKEYQTEKIRGAAEWFRANFPSFFREGGLRVKGIFVDSQGLNEVVFES